MNIQRQNIGIFGKMNAGKSTLMNLLTQQPTSIVDATPGTTTDTKIAFMEIHGIGPIKIFDTAGIDEEGILGAKKKLKVLSLLNECDALLILIDPSHINLNSEEELLKRALKQQKEVLIIYNLFTDKDYNIKETHDKLFHKIAYLSINLEKNEAFERVILFLQKHLRQKKEIHSFLPPFLKEKDIVFLNIPMDEETPQGRLLRPQAKVEEYLLRNFIGVFSYRMNLKKARDSAALKKERDHFRHLIKTLPINLLITDSQAIDIIDEWTLDEEGKELVKITTFSLVMINDMSEGRLFLFVKGIEALENLKENSKILIAEGCNHNRIREDIGTVQIPTKLKKRFGNLLTIEHAFGKEIEDKDLSKYDLVIHCGGCMLDKQKLNARLSLLFSLNIPVTNYGMILAYLHSPATLKRILSPWTEVFYNKKRLHSHLGYIVLPVES